jgi:hypothetical protein
VPNDVTTRPDPDPTLLTTESLLREIAHLKELTIEKFKTDEVRITSIESRLDHKYKETADAISNLRELHNEKFNGMDRLQAQSKEDGRISLDAAFSSANATRDKIEDKFDKQIRAQGDKTDALSTSLNEKIDRVISRLDMSEGRIIATQNSRQESVVDRGQSISIGQGLIALVGVLIALAVFISTRT